MAASWQQAVEQLTLLVTSDPNSISQGPIELLKSIYNLLFSLRDWGVILVIGSLFETARRLLSAVWNKLINAFFITAAFSEHDSSYQWIMLWLSKQPSWNGVRNVQISTTNFDIPALQGINVNTMDIFSRKVSYIPAISESYSLWYKWRWITITRTTENAGQGWHAYDTVTLNIFAFGRGILDDILEDAKKAYAEAQKDTITVYISDNRGNNGWRELSTRPKRPLNSVVLEPGVIDLVIDDVRDFLDSKAWYVERGIPFRRGYLFYGAPGSGKTSLIHSIAGEVGLSVYIISLSQAGLDDGGLSELISALPERCIALMEDIDAAFHHSLTRESPEGTSTQPSPNPDDPSSSSSSSSAAPPSQPAPTLPPPSSNRVSLSGLLNALDGIGAQEGRVLFATTNRYSALDPALCRPGRMDLHVEFKLASRRQAEELFKRFYSPAAATAATTRAEHSPSSHEHENGTADVLAEGDEKKDLIDLSDAETGDQDAQDAPTTTHAYACVGASHRLRAPVLSQDRVNALAARFASAIPEYELSMASLQGFLMMHKTQPFGATAQVEAWVRKEMAERSERRK